MKPQVQVNKNKDIVNYILSSIDSDIDNSIYVATNDKLYWSLGKIRKMSLLVYDFQKYKDILIVGDELGTFIEGYYDGAHVDYIVESKEASKVIIKRSKGNISNIFVEPYDDWNLDTNYECVLVNLENTNGYDWHNSYEFDRLVDPAIKHLTDDGKLLLFIRGDRLYDVERLLYYKDFKYAHYCDPLGNGAYFIEASRVDNLTEFKLERPSPLLDDKWVRKHGMPFMGGEIFDQDIERIEEVKAVQVDLLKKLVEVCKANNITVYPIYGTLLGIIRDGGMIPGDDDIDVAMSREDYNRLLKLTDAFDGKYFLQTPYNDDCFYGGYMKLRNKETTAIHPQNEWVECCEGISIDIFPLDRSYENEEKEKAKCRKIRTLQRLLFAKSYGYFKQFRDMPMLKWKFYKYLGLKINRNKMIDKLFSIMQKGNRSNCRYAIYCHYGNGAEVAARYVDISDFSSTIPLLYEGVMMQVPVGWDRLLKGFYGEGYWNRLGFNEGKRRHGFYDVNTPYIEYKRRFGGLKHPETISEPIVFFGDGSLFKSCLSYYKDRVSVAHLVLLPGEDEMSPVFGINVENWDSFMAQNIDRNTYRAVICSGNARSAEKILRKAGFDRYYIFWYERNWMLYANQTQIWKEINKI